MINLQKIKKLAQIAGSSDNIPADIEKFVLNYMSKQELKDFMRFYKSVLDKRRVYVYAASELSKDTEKLLKDLYKDKEIYVDIEKSLGAGLKIRQDDMLIDFTFKKYINETLEKLKN
jgi:F0F1-type ATP synthase delta subunit